MAEIDRIRAILDKNKAKPFVKRIITPSEYPILDLGDGSHATHKMAWGQTGDKYVVFPTVFFEGDTLTDYGDRAFKRAMTTGNFIEFDDPNDASWFSQNYKKFWGDNQ